MLEEHQADRRHLHGHQAREAARVHRPGSHHPAHRQARPHADGPRPRAHRLAGPRRRVRDGEEPAPPPLPGAAAGQGVGRRPGGLHRDRPPREGQGRSPSSTRRCASSSTCATSARSSPRRPSARYEATEQWIECPNCETEVPTSNGIHCPECGEDMRGGEYVRAVLHLVDDADGRIYRGIDSLTVRSAGFPEYRGMSLERIQGSNLWVSFRRYDPLPDEGIVLPTASVEMFEAQRSVIRQLQIGSPRTGALAAELADTGWLGSPPRVHAGRQEGPPPAGPQRGAGRGGRPRHGHAPGPAVPDPGTARHRQDDRHRGVDPAHPRPQPERLDPPLLALQRRRRHRPGAAARLLARAPGAHRRARQGAAPASGRPSSRATTSSRTTWSPAPATGSPSTRACASRSSTG